MTQLELLMRNIIPYIAIGITVIGIIFVSIKLNQQDKLIINLYMNNHLDECLDRIKLIKRYSFGSKITWLRYYESLVFIAQEKYADARVLLLNIKSNSYKRLTLFWLGFISIKMNKTEDVFNYLSQLKEISSTNTVDLEVLNCMYDNLSDKTVRLSQETYMKITDPNIRKYVGEYGLVDITQ